MSIYSAAFARAPGPETTPEPSTPGVVDITQNARLELQVLQPMLDHIADADDTGQLAAAQYRHVAHAMVRHQLHDAIDAFVRRHGGHAVLHDFLHGHRPGRLAIAGK